MKVNEALQLPSRLRRRLGGTKKPAPRRCQQRAGNFRFWERLRLQLLQFREVLDGADHLRGVGVLVVVPRHDLNLIGVVVATLNFHDFFVIVHNFETTVTVPQHTVVVPKPACSYQDYTTFRRYFQGFSQFCVLELSHSLYFFLCTYIFM